MKNNFMRDPVFILGPGRCGSTLIQRILNTSHDLTIWGEHGGFLKTVAKSYYELIEGKQIVKNIYENKGIEPSMVIGELKEYKKSINWVNSFNKQTVKQSYKQLLINLLNNDLDTNYNFWGFNSILYIKS